MDGESTPPPPPLPGKMKALLGEALKMFTFATDPIRITPRVIFKKNNNMFSIGARQTRNFLQCLYAIIKL